MSLPRDIDLSAVPPSLVRHGTIMAMLAIATAMPAGAFAELGVYQGGTAWWLGHVARSQARELWLFDTFTGIPNADAVDLHKVGDFGDTSLAQIEALIHDAIIVPGVFPGSAQGYALPPLAFAHVDADQYSSVKAACEVFGPLMVPGGVMWFDDYGCPSTPGATQAVDECFAGRIEPPTRSGGRALVRFS